MKWICQGGVYRFGSLLVQPRWPREKAMFVGAMGQIHRMKTKRTPLRAVIIVNGQQAAVRRFTGMATARKWVEATVTLLTEEP